MGCRAVFTIFLGLLAFATPVSAQRLTVEERQRACAQPDLVELCYAALRAGMERRQFSEDASADGCRMTGISRADLLPRDGYVQLCRGAPGYWTNAQLGASCRRDPAGPCRYFIDTAISRAIVDMRLRSWQTFCFKPAEARRTVLDQPIEFLPDLFLAWLRANSGRVQEPAALGIEHAIAESYPCSPEEAQIRLRVQRVCNGPSDTNCLGRPVTPPSP